MSSINILVVEDNPGDFALLEEMLSNINSFEKDIAHVEKLEDTHKLLKNKNFDIVFLDLSLPDSSGLETFHSIYSNYPLLPIVVFTGFSDSTLAIEAVKSGAQDYLFKGEINSRLIEKTISYSIARKKAEADILLKANILQNVRDAVIVTDTKGKIIYWNEGATIKFGYDAREVQGRSLAFLYYDPITEDILLETLQAILNGEDFSGEWKGKRKDGTSIWIHVKTRAMKDSQGNPIGLIGVSRSIEERKKSEEKLKKSEATLKAIFNSTYQSFVLIDNDCKIVFFNEVAQSLSMSTVNQPLVEGTSFLDQIPSFSKELFLQRFNNALKGQLIKTESNIPCKNNDGIWLETYFTPVEDNLGTTIGVSLSTIDITQRKKDEAKIKEQNVELQKTNSELDRFVYSASHDLKAPLSAILGIINVALIDPEASSRETYFMMIEKNIKRLMNVIKDLTNFSRNARLEVLKEEIDFKFMVEEILSSLAYLKNSTKISFNYKVEKVQSFVSDPLRIQILLNNLIANAIMFHNVKQDHPYVNILITSKERSVEIIVEDNGLGIEETCQEKVFDMFYRASTNSEGSGLGLYIVKGIVEKLKGTVDMKSCTGKGTRFLINIPEAQ